MRKKEIFSNETKNSFEEDLVKEIIDDFKKRQEERRSYEAQWELNMNFLMGNQYSVIGMTGEVEEYDKQYFWQEREVYNHIAPIIDSRLAKLLSMKPIMTVIPASSDERDIKTAKISKKIINSIYNKLSVSGAISEANNWSEVCGTSFYKVAWNSDKGTVLGENDKGEKVASGDIEITVCPAFEIFPESSSCADISDCKSLIHARAFHVDDIKRIWGIDVEGQDINVFSLDNVHAVGKNGYFGNIGKVINSVRNNYAIVIEKYESPTIEFPNGRLIIVAGDRLVNISELPYVNGHDGERGFPFIRQTSIEHPGCFWGSSIIERLIPIQRSFNTIKNRKHEFMNRLSMGVLAVEDGSVDTDNLEGEGLSPGKVLVYRQGSTPPAFMSFGRIPVDFISEETNLLNEFTYISGVSDLMTTSSTNYSNMSGEALQILINQDDSRITVSADKIKDSIKNMAKHILRLYKQFATIPRLSKIIGDNGDIEVFYFNSSDISSDDVIFETSNEVGETITQKRSMIFQLLNAGLLHDESGKLSNTMRIKVLEMLGFGVWENSQDVHELHIKKAARENLKFIEGEKKVEPLEIDDHELHINEHTAFILGGEFQKKQERRPEILDGILNHIRTHKQMMSIQNELDNRLNQK